MFRRGIFPLALIILWMAGLFISGAPGPAAAAETSRQSGPLVLWLTGSGALTAPMADYLDRGLRQAEQRGAEALVFQLNTPGGSVQLMNQMVTSLRNSRTPVVVYVAPAGGMAASAGTLITLAGQAAAMAPETTIGAASPVGSGGEELDPTSAAKLKNDLMATARGLAERRGPDAVAFAEAAIDSAAAIHATEALQAGVIDFIAADRADLLRQLDGFSVLIGGQPETIETAFAEVVDFNPSFIETLLGILTNPNIVLLLLNVGIIAILIELSSPGGWVSGFIGVVSLALGVYGLGILPVNWFGIAFLVIAFALFILDIKMPTHGGLTAAGVGSLIVGMLVLFNSRGVPEFQRVSIPLVLISSAITGGLFLLILAFALRAQRVPIRTGQESLVGRTGLAHTDLGPDGIVQVGGEQWSAHLAEGEQPVPRGGRVEVVQVNGLRLVVRKVG